VTFTTRAGSSSPAGSGSSSGNRPAGQAQRAVNDRVAYVRRARYGPDLTVIVRSVYHGQSVLRRRILPQHNSSFLGNPGRGICPPLMTGPRDGQMAESGVGRGLDRGVGVEVRPGRYGAAIS
jgi:hypothetical protein